MTDLGAFNYFLRISVIRDARGMFLSQKKYDMELLERAHMSNCGLQYLTFTRPDISYVVQQICLHMHDPRESHLAALKRVLRYIRGTLDHGLQLHVIDYSQLNASTDAEWTGVLLHNVPTSGYCLFLRDKLLCLSAKCLVTLSLSPSEAISRLRNEVVRNSLDPQYVTIGEFLTSCGHHVTNDADIFN
ncbi:ribonuclease H-like domain-containing protein [Tanacetum coccineum]